LQEKGDIKMKKKTLLIVLLVASMVLLPLLAIQARGLLDAGPDQTVRTGQTVTFNGTTTENASSIVQVTWDFGDGSTPVNGSSPTLLNTTTHTYTTPGVYNATLTVKYDSTLNKTESDTVTITALQNQPPIANAGPDQTIEQTSPQGAMVTLNGTGSYDPENDTLTYNWTWPGGSAQGVTPTVLFPAGKTTVTLTVSDGQYTATDTVNITVQDTTPPQINATVTPEVLWPPNHNYVEIKANVTVYDIGDPSPEITLVSVTSNEPDNGIGDGNTIYDFVIVNDFTFNLREERDGTGSGRIYTITYKATDASGNSALASATVTVKHNQ
jgi:PKD repeat protein